jgi:hypothetical protein
VRTTTSSISFEIEIDEMAIQLLTKAPLASNLRLVTVAMKISQNLERIGDEATKIAKRAKDLSLEPPVKLNLDLPKLAKMALSMVKDSLDSFVQKDSTAARAIIPRDKEVDALNKQIHDVLAQHMTENPDTIGRCLHWIVDIRPRAWNGLPTTPRTSPKRSFIFARPRTSVCRKNPRPSPCAGRLNGRTSHLPRPTRRRRTRRS